MAQNPFSPFDHPTATPVYPDTYFYHVVGGVVRPWEFSGWQAESLAWKEGCYIHAGLTIPGGQWIFEGPDAIEFFSRIAVNGFGKFPIGSAKHAVMCTDEGLIASHGVLQRNGENEVQLFVAGLWANYQCAKSDLRVTARPADNYLFQIAGPTSLQTLERATGESLRDIGFLRFRKSSIGGRPLEVMRIGMAGSLAYELHGPMEHAAEVYDAVVNAGEGLGLERLGWRTYTVNHVEAGFPQTIWTFTSAADEDPGFREFMAQFPQAGVMVSGSVDPTDMRARYRTPNEVGWEKMVRLDHDFIGRTPIESELRDPKRTIATLVWNAEDVVDIYASLLRKGEEFKIIELPTSPHLRGYLSHADHILKDGRPVGWSSGTIYSYYYREVISHATIDLDQTRIGNEVVVRWGDHGGRIKDVRARVERYPYLDVARNQEVDVSAIA